MHIPDSFLPPRVCLLGYALTGLGTWYSLHRIRLETNPTEQIPKASLLTAGFFVASLIHIPLPPSSIHLVFNGLMGIMLGYYAFPAILIGLFFQAVMFQHGGLTTLGVNGVIMGFPALFAYYFFRFGQRFTQDKSPWWQSFFVFLAGGGALAISALIFTLVILSFIPADFDVQTEQTIALIALIGYGIQAVIEGIFTVMFITFIQRVKPELLNNRNLRQDKQRNEAINQS